MKKDIILSGVGGQGILSIATVIGKAALKEGLYMKQAEVHGMSQRGGSVVTYVKYGSEVCSPVVEKGEADIIISFEQLEAARYVSYLKKGGHIITSTQQIDPMPVITGAAQYPANIVDTLKSLGEDVIAVDALSLAEQAGTSRAVNVVLMGVISHILDFGDKVWNDALEQCVPAKVLEVNKKAFGLGRNA